MPRLCPMLIALLAVLIAAEGVAQPLEGTDLPLEPRTRLYGPMPLAGHDGSDSVRDMSDDVLLDAVEPQRRGESGSVEKGASGSRGQDHGPRPLGQTSSLPLNDGSVPLERPDEPAPAALGDFMGYRHAASSLDYIPGGGDKFGMFALVWNHYQQAGMHSGLGLGMGFHFLGGPVQTDMPPRVYDFSMAYQIRSQWGPLRFDVAASVLAASDFEGSARKGILFPGHAVGYLSLEPEFDLVFGIDYLSRGDVKLLPVAGCVWTPTPDFRFEIVFPRPRAVFQFAPRQRLYVSGELGGGSWAIERVSGANDLATYRDLGVYLGLEQVDKDDFRWAFEVGYLFERRLEYASRIGNTPLSDAMMLRWVTRF